MSRKPGLPTLPIPPKLVQDVKVKPPKTEERRAASMPGTMLTSRLIKPVGAAMLLLASLAHATSTTVGAPQGGAGACPFPGCMTTAAGLDLTQPPYNVAPGTGDMTGRVQMAVDSGAPVLLFPAGTIPVCNLFARAKRQRWLGAGIGQTILTAPPGGCNNLIVETFNNVFSGPVEEFAIEGMTFQGMTQQALVLQCRDMERITVRNNAFDTGSVGCALGPNGISMNGCRNFVIEDNEFYSSCPGGGGRGMLLGGIRGGTIRRNVSTWQRTFMEMASTANQPIEFTNITDNVYHGTFWGTPTKYTNSGATVSYAGSVLTDTAASFAGLCDAGGASPCAAAAGNFVRALTAKVTGTTGTFNTQGGYLTDATKDFVATAVQRGDLVKTTPVCLGNGDKPQTLKGVCTATAGTGGWGDGCVCTATADCASAICEPRWTTVDTVGDTHNLQVDEWVRETACPLGSAICAPSTRRPTGAPVTFTGLAYTIYGWSACQIASYTGTSVTCNSDAWFTWTGSASTPANTTLYEIMYSRPLYFLLAGNTGITAIQGLRAVNNTAVGGFADHFELTGTRIVVEANHSRDCGDTCFVFAGDQYTVGNNIAEHCGARGMIAIGNDQTWGNNVAVDSPWVRVSNTTTAGDINIIGSRNTLVGNKVKAELPVNLNRYGYAISGTSDQNQLTGNTCQGTYSAGCIRLDGAASTNTHLLGYHGESISTAGGATFSIEGGLATFAQTVTAGLAPLNGSFVGCTDCTPASPCVAGGGNGSILKRQGAAWNCP